MRKKLLAAPRRRRMPRWVVLLLLARASGAEGPRVVFVAADAERGKWGTFAHRGVSNADLLNASTALCASVASDFDVYVHVKYPCARALDFPGRRGHVYDVLDQKNENFLRDARLHAVVFASDWDLRRRCADLVLWQTLQNGVLAAQYVYLPQAKLGNAKYCRSASPLKSVLT